MNFDGKKLAGELQEKLRSKVATFSIVPSLLIIQVGDNPASNSFVAIKKKVAQVIGVECIHKRFQDTTTEELLAYITSPKSKDFSGIIVQLPLPEHIDTQKILQSIPKEKDIDVLGPQEIEFFENNYPIPPVVGAFLESVAYFDLDYSKERFVVVGMGRLVGKPIYSWLKNNNANVDIIDIDTEKEKKKILLQEATCIISGVGIPNLITPKDINDNVYIIDLGASLYEGVIVGDFDKECYKKAKGYTPVPGGLGPLTVVKLFENLLSFSEKK